MLDCMMGGDCMMGMGGMVFMWLFWIAVLALIVWGVYRIVAGGAAASPTASPRETPEETLRRRYAEGEITTEEYEERRGRLER